MSKASDEQPEPVTGDRVVVDVVLADIRERAEMGKKKYGFYLQTHNGRDPLWDAYQEAVDLVFYLRQAIMEHEADLDEAGTRRAKFPHRGEREWLKNLKRK